MVQGMVSLQISQLLVSPLAQSNMTAALLSVLDIQGFVPYSSAIKYFQSSNGVMVKVAVSVINVDLALDQ